MSGDWQISVDTLREDVSGDQELVTVTADDVRAVLGRIDELVAIEQRATRVRDGGMQSPFGPMGRIAARHILGELSWSARLR